MYYNIKKKKQEIKKYQDNNNKKREKKVIIIKKRSIKNKRCVFTIKTTPVDFKTLHAAK